MSAARNAPGIGACGQRGLAPSVSAFSVSETTPREVPVPFCHATRLPTATLALTILALVAIGSLTPFSIDTAGRFGLLGWPKLKLVDVATNLLLYVPVGLSLTMWYGRRVRCSISVLLAAGSATLLSLGLEAAQALIATRYASWYDVAFNGLGALCGAVAFLSVRTRVIEAARALRCGLRRDPLEAVSRWATYGVFVHALAPFDFVTTAEGLVRSLHGTRLPLLAAIQAGRLLPAGPAPIAAGVTVATLPDLLVASMFMMLGCLTVLARRGPCRPKSFGAWGAVGAGWLLAALIETLQVFSVQHAFDFFDLLRNGGGATVGAVLAIVAARSRASAAPCERRRLSLPTFVLAVFWLAPTIVALAAGSTMIVGGASGVWARGINWVPFADYFQRPLLAAVGTMLETAGAVAVLTATAYALGARLKRCALPWAQPLVAALATVAAAGWVAGASAHPSVSDAVVGALGGLVALGISRWLVGALRSRVSA